MIRLKTRSIALALLISFAPAAVPTLAFSQPVVDDATTKAARARFQEGVDAFDKGQYENARAAFLQAYALRKHPAVLLNLAQSSLKSGHSIESLKYFQQYLRDQASPTPQQRADAEKGIAEARIKLGRLDVSAPTGAEISVDNDRVGNAPLAEPVDVEPGTHTVRARYADGTAEGKTVGVNVGEKMAVKFGATAGAVVVPVPVPAPAAPPPSAPATPPSATPPPPDTVVTTTTAPPPGADTGPSTKKKFGPPKTMIPVYVGGAMVALGVVDAVVFAIFKKDAQGKADTVANDIRTHKNPSPPSNVCGPPVKSNAFAGACLALKDNNDKVDQDALFANIGVGVAIAGGVLAVGWYLLAPRKEDVAPPPSTTWKKIPTIAPMLGSTNRGISLTGEF